jgi:hypothetical protein
LLCLPDRRLTVRDEKSLTSGTSKDGQLFPARAGGWKQSFPVSSASELWSRHKDALEYLSEVAGFQPAKGTRDLPDEFVRAMRSESEHVRSIPLWPLRIPYWYFVRRNVRHGKSIRQLMDS